MKDFGATDNYPFACFRETSILLWERKCEEFSVFQKLEVVQAACQFWMLIARLNETEHFPLNSSAMKQAFELFKGSFLVHIRQLVMM